MNTQTLASSNSRIANAPADIAPMATFVVYVVIATVRNDSSLLAAKAFTSLSLIALVADPVLVFIESAPAVIECMGCFDRIQEYCSKEVHPNDSSDGALSRGSSVKLKKLPSLRPEGSLITFQDQSSAWNQGSPGILHRINLEILHGTITMIIGPIGSGKSTLLESILGESLSIGGQSIRNFSTAAYCSQVPWLRSQTVRQNIVGTTNLDDDWYKRVVWACGLDGEFSQLPEGDDTAVGSQGLTLSGGQRQRIVGSCGTIVSTQTLIETIGFGACRLF